MLYSNLKLTRRFFVFFCYFFHYNRVWFYKCNIAPYGIIWVKDQTSSSTTTHNALLSLRSGWLGRLKNWEMRLTIWSAAAEHLVMELILGTPHLSSLTLIQLYLVPYTLLMVICSVNVIRSHLGSSSDLRFSVVEGQDGHYSTTVIRRAQKGRLSALRDDPNKVPIMSLSDKKPLCP